MVRTETKKSLLFERDFAMLWLSRLISVAGTSIIKVVLPLHVLRLTGSESLTALITTVTVLPVLILGIPAGTIADRVNRLKLIRYCEVLSAIAVVILSIFIGAPSSATWIIYAALIALSIFAVFFDAASFGILPELVGKDRLPEANSLLYGSNTVISLLAPAVAGFMYDFLNIQIITLINAITFSISFVLLLSISTSRLKFSTSYKATSESSFRSMISGVSFLFRYNNLKLLMWTGCLAGLTGGAMQAALIPLADAKEFGLDNIVGFTLTASGMGAFLSTLVLSKVANKVPHTWISLGCFSLSLVAYVAVIFSPDIVVLLAGSVAWGFFYTAMFVNNVSLRQMIIPDSLQGRVNMTARTLVWGATPLGAALVSSSFAVLTVTQSLILMAAPLAIVAITVWFTDFRLREWAPIPEPASSDEINSLSG